MPVNIFMEEILELQPCPSCQDRGVIIQGNVAFPCHCAAKRAAERCFKSSCLPVALRSFLFEKFNFKYYSRHTTDSPRGSSAPKGLSFYESARITFKAAQNFVDNFSQNKSTDGLFFTGPIGSGKTFLACCIANALLEKGHLVLFIVVPDLLDLIRSTYEPGRASGEVTELELLDTARKAPLLILDDLGAHNYTDWVRNKLYSILNYRLNYSLPVVITSNIKLEDLEEYLGERITSRIYQLCRPYRLLVDMDIRVLQRQEKAAR